MALWPTLGDNLNFTTLIKFSNILKWWAGRKSGGCFVLCYDNLGQITNERWVRGHEVVRFEWYCDELIVVI